MTVSGSPAPAARLLAAGVLFAPERTKTGWLTETDVLVMKSFVLTAVLGSLVLYGLVDDMLVGVFLGITTIAQQHHAGQRTGNGFNQVQLPIRLNR